MRLRRTPLSLRLHLALLANFVLVVGIPVFGQAESGNASTSTTLPRRADGLMPGMVPWKADKANVALAPTCNGPQLSYFGGPLVQTPTIVPVFWSSAVNSTLQANIPQFYADVVNSSYWQWLTEYDSVGLPTGSNQAILAGTGLPGVVITPLKCAPGGTNCAVTDADIQSELSRQIGLGTLPAPTFDCTGNVKTIYMVHFPSNIALRGPGGIRSCVSGGFCAYHNTGTYGAASTPLIYGALMDGFAGPCSSGCAPESTGLARSTDVASHELVEAVTDPDIGLVTAIDYAYPAGWAENLNNCGEIADICADGTSTGTITVSGRTWSVQPLWSNQQNACTSSGPVTPICSSTNLTGCRKCSCGDTGLSCNGSTSVCETTSSNVLFGACEQCTSLSNPCTGGRPCQQSSSPAQDDICSACVPLTSCPPGDNCGTVPDGCGGAVSCGTCTAPQTCGGGSGNPNVCGCTLPTGVAALAVDKPAAGTARLSWSYGGSDATSFDIVRGDLSALRANAGAFYLATSMCLADGTTGPVDDPNVPSPGAPYWYLLRAVDCGGTGKGSYGSSDRDTGIHGSNLDCN